MMISKNVYCVMIDAVFERRVNQYMAFGLSASSEATFMIGADATVAWVDSNTGMPNAVDYILTQRIQVCFIGCKVYMAMPVCLLIHDYYCG